MGTLTVTEFVTLDGVAQAPGGRDEDREDGFPYGGWQAPLLDREAVDVVFAQAATMDALLLGRRTYDIFAGYWPTAPREIPFTDLLNRVPKYVAGRTLADPPAWNGARILTGPVVNGVAALKERHDDVQVIGSLDLVQSLLGAGLVDRLRLWVHPVLLGRGKRLFADGTVPTALRLTESAVFPTGTVQLVYEVAGTPTFGELAV